MAILRAPTRIYQHELLASLALSSERNASPQHVTSPEASNRLEALSYYFALTLARAPEGQGLEPYHIQGHTGTVQVLHPNSGDPSSLRFHAARIDGRSSSMLPEIFFLHRSLQRCLLEVQEL